MTLFRAPDFPTTGTRTHTWLLKPYIPAEGIIFLYGKKGVGKSPLTWSLARSVASGEPWMGLPIQTPGPTLYIELDSPLSVVKERADLIQWPGDLWFYFPRDPVIAHGPGYHQMIQDTAPITPKPQFVIINTLRKCHTLDDRSSHTSSFIYSTFRRLWDCVLFVHHEKKTPGDPTHQLETGEEFSGALSWHNDAQICLNLRAATRSKDDGTHNLHLVNTGNQVAAKAPTLNLLLDADGFTITPR